MSIKENLNVVNEKIAGACLKAGRKRDDVALEAVSKFHPVEAIGEAYNAGQRLFGENRVQEAGAKFTPAFRAGRPGLELHLIGSLQKNKAKLAALNFDAVESVDNEDLITALAKYAAGAGRLLPVFLELNAGEASKGGFRGMDALLHGAELLMKYADALQPAGLMIMAPLENADGVPYTETERDAAAHKAFAFCREARDTLQAALPGKFPDGRPYWGCLSMGMSGDFEAAIAEGSNLVRIGTAIFGERVYA
jgi:pyridoxal phosphate enzyme (YggS family)